VQSVSQTKQSQAYKTAADYGVIENWIAIVEIYGAIR
jgi:hypothetical protein